MTINEKQTENHDHTQKSEKARPAKSLRLVSAILPDGAMVETLYDPESRQTSFCIGQDNEWKIESEVEIDGRHWRPYSPENNLIRHNVVLFPSQPQLYGDEETLIEDIKRYLHTYVDLSSLFEDVAAHYVLLTWLHDAYAELPYLRVRGDYGCGKTRFLLVLGSICYKPIFASGASTVSPLFRLLDSIGGTLILDESDFRMSDEKAEMSKILNNGNVKGFPVLRSEATDSGEFDPKAYSVFGPKILASRGWFEDRALESRFITEELGGRKLRPDIPLNLGDEYRQEALNLRNKLLMFRFANRARCHINTAHHDPSIEPRLNQIFAPLLSVVRQPSTIDRLRHLMREYQASMTDERGEDTEAAVLEIIRDLIHSEERPAIKTITERLIQNHTSDSYDPITPKWVGSLIRRRLHLRTHKSHGVYVLAAGQERQLNYLYARYGLEKEKLSENSSPDAPGNLPV